MFSLPLIVCLIGFLVWLVCGRPSERGKHWLESLLAEAGKLSFFAGLLSYLFQAGE